MYQINVHVAERLRRLRAAGGLSLQDLARRSGVSRAMLSQIETPKTNPTIAVLWKIAHGLAVTFAQLLGTPAAPPCGSSGRRRALLFSGDRARSRPMLANVPGHAVELYELRLEPAGWRRRPPIPGELEQIRQRRTPAPGVRLRELRPGTRRRTALPRRPSAPLRNGGTPPLRGTVAHPVRR